MKDFEDKVAVVTGAASGIGRATAERCVKEGMKVVLVDIEEQALVRTEKELKALGADALLSVQTDVSRVASMEALAQKVYDTYGAVHFLFNNAGVASGGPIWENTLQDWEWVMGVNLWGVIHGVRLFVPRMIAQDTEGHVVNTASMAGLITGQGLGIYNVTKFGVVALSETLYKELNAAESKIKVSVLCPGWVNTQIHESARNRPADMQNAEEKPPTPEQEAGREMMAQVLQAGLSPHDVADQIFNAVINEKFYILTHPDMKPLIQMRMDDILQENNPMAFNFQ